MMNEWILGICIKILSKWFPYVDVYSPNDNVEAITLSKSENYIKKVTKIK